MCHRAYISKKKCISNWLENHDSVQDLKGVDSYFGRRFIAANLIDSFKFLDNSLADRRLTRLPLPLGLYGACIGCRSYEFLRL